MSIPSPTPSNHARVLTRDEVRRFDQLAVSRFGIHSLVLMENAARGVADILTLHFGNTASYAATIYCGPGNNGGDGLAVARHLHIRGWRVQVICTHKPESFSEDAIRNFEILARTEPGSRIQFLETASPSKWHFPESGVIVDALLGTGVTGSLRAPFSELVNELNQSGLPCLAVDIPSGLPADGGRETEELPQSIQADHTVTFVAMKPVMQTAAGRIRCGEITIADIGAPPEIFDLLNAESP